MSMWTMQQEMQPSFYYEPEIEKQPSRRDTMSTITFKTCRKCGKVKHFSTWRFLTIEELAKTVGKRIIHVYTLCDLC